MRRALDMLYRAAGGLAALFIVAIVALVFAQVGLNLADKITAALTGTGLGVTIPSYADFTGFFLAASSFLALAYTLRKGGHIRVTLITQGLGQRANHVAEIVVTTLALGMAGFGTWYMVLLVLESHEFGDKSSGMVSVPLWIPQLPVALGLAVLTLALADELVSLLRGHPASWADKGETLLNE
ncbi:TRAP transporter small permease [Roseovarius sp. A21]|uniref:TRAP transporter small permease protein n=1 Tax=Roseovarius bejariae TaxID=2576383 RepID=A0A844D4Y0_9RHOB|nr:TRAP transporter small permease [Roseovarius bejariae]MRU16348.1 TRAP transporter small permease [Roseovarius bejariae]